MTKTKDKAAAPNPLAGGFINGMLAVVTTPDPKRGAWAQGLRGSIVAVSREGLCTIRFDDKRLYHAWPHEITRAGPKPRGKRSNKREPNHYG